MASDELSRNDSARLLPNVTMLVSGIVAQALAQDMQENLYGRPNFWAGTVDKLQRVIGMRPDFMTSFTGPLLGMQAAQVICVMGQMASEKSHKPDRERLFRTVKFLAPVAVALAFVGYEASGLHWNGQPYLDNPTADNLATLAALGISMATGLVSEKVFWKTGKRD